MKAPNHVRIRTRSSAAGSNASIPAAQTRSNWSYAGANTLKRDCETELAWHPAVKPVALVKDAIKDCSKPGGIILDAFGGSGTTLIAAAKTKRRGFLIELEPKYVDVTVRRWEALFGTEARHAETGLTFAEMKRQRESDLTGTRQGGEAGHVER